MPGIESLELPVQKWLFVDDPDLQRILARDYRELRSLLKAGAQKSVVVMCGSILEAALVSVLATDSARKLYEAKKGQPLDVRTLSKFSLEDLINVATDLNILEQNMKADAHLIRNYRNLIHPGLEVRKSISVDALSVTAVVSVFERSIQRLATFGLAKDDASQQATFLNQLKMRRGEAEAEVAREIFEKLGELGFVQDWGKNLMFLPRYHLENTVFTPLSMRPDGSMRIRFGFMYKSGTPFRFRAKRLELMSLLNRNPNIHIKSDQIEKFPNVPLKTLVDRVERDKYLILLDWIRTEILPDHKHVPGH